MDGLNNAATQQFEIVTRDGRTALKGKVNLPADGRARYPVVLIVNGGWFMERDGFIGRFRNRKDLVYRDLANDIVAAGIAVVRYDNRGAFCADLRKDQSDGAGHSG